MKKVAVLQSNYIPWKGYFDIIHDVDLFVFYDDVQFTVQDWRTRNKIYNHGKLQWLSVEVHSRRCLEKKINEIQILERSNWQRKHWNSLKCAYGKTPYFHLYKPFLESVYMETTWTSLSELNQFLVTEISRSFLGIQTQFAQSSDFETTGSSHERLLSLVRATGATSYLSGPAAKEYIIAQDYQDVGIELIWKDYSDYPEYQQSNYPFVHQVTILDLLFNTGPDAPYYIWGWRDTKKQKRFETCMDFMDA